MSAIPVGNPAGSPINGDDVGSFKAMAAALIFGIIFFVISLLWVIGMCFFRFVCGCCGGRKKMSKKTVKPSRREKIFWRVFLALSAIGLIGGGLAGLAGLGILRNEINRGLDLMQTFQDTGAAVAPVARSTPADNDALRYLRDRAVQLAESVRDAFPSDARPSRIKDDNVSGVLKALTVLAVFFFVFALIGAALGIWGAIRPGPGIMRTYVLVSSIFVAWLFLLFAALSVGNTAGSTACEIPGWIEGRDAIKATYMFQQVQRCERDGVWAPLYFQPGDAQGKLTPDDAGAYCGAYNQPANITSMSLGMDQDAASQVRAFQLASADLGAGLRQFEKELKDYLGARAASWAASGARWTSRRSSRAWTS
eukprot:tig00020629_g12353.t1